jgi:hypothetical protein
MRTALLNSLLVLLCMLFLGTYSEAQQVLQIETYGKVKARRFVLGDEIEFQTSRFPDVWMKRTLYGIDADNQLIDIGDGWLPVNSIYRMRIDNPSFWRKFGLAFAYSSAVTTLMGSAWAWVFAGVPPNWIAISLMIGPVAIAEIVKRTTRYRTFNIGKRHRVKALDLTIYGPMP